MIETFVWLLAWLLVLMTVTVHYETLMLVSDKVIPWAVNRFHNRRVIPIAIAALMVGHIAEIWLFALSEKILLQYPDIGYLVGGTGKELSDLLYLSAVNYTSLGDSSLRIAGAVRELASTEPLVGMVMIAWSASFTYLKMEQEWKKDDERK
jgi:hypothetical protein